MVIDPWQPPDGVSRSLVLALVLAVAEDDRLGIAALIEGSEPRLLVEAVASYAGWLGLLICDGDRAEQTSTLRELLAELAAEEVEP